MYDLPLGLPVILSSWVYGVGVWCGYIGNVEKRVDGKGREGPVLQTKDFGMVPTDNPGFN